MTKRCMVALLAALAVLFGAVAGFAAETFDYPITGLGWEVTTDVKANENYVLACVVKNAVNPYMIKQLEGMEVAAKLMGFTAITLAPGKADNIEEQVSLIEDLLLRGVDGIVIHPSDSNGIVPAVEAAVAQGVPVVTIGTPANTDLTFMRTGVDYRETGYVIGKWVAEELGGKGNVIILEGPPQAENAIERLRGIEEAFAEYPEIKIIASQTANFRRVEGMQVMKNLLQRFRQVDAVIGCNDEMAMGAVMAIEAAGRDREGIIIAGFDANQDACNAIAEGRMHVTYNTDPMSSAIAAAAYLVMYLNDGTLPPAAFVPYPAAVHEPLVTRENIQYFMEHQAWWK